MVCARNASSLISLIYATGELAETLMKNGKDIALDKVLGKRSFSLSFTHRCLDVRVLRLSQWYLYL